MRSIPKLFLAVKNAQNFQKTVIIFEKLLMTLIKELIPGNYFCLKKKLSIYKNVVVRGGSNIFCFW